MPADRRTTQAVAEAAARGPGTTDPLLGELRRSGLLPVLVLHFIAEAPSYGNQLMERIENLSGGALAVNPNTMYPLLRQLESAGWVAGAWEHPERRSRRFYRLTGAGEAERDRLVAELGPRLDAVARGVALVRRELGA
jgi:PadR family transcriptional regulator, regulatory protein PadR